VVTAQLQLLQCQWLLLVRLTYWLPFLVFFKTQRLTALLNFTSAPPSGTGNISCRYLGVPVTGVTTTAYRTVTEFTATASQTTFTPPSYTVGFINVYRNGVLLGSADYTATNGTTVVLATGATAGDLVTVESFQVSSVVNAIQNTAGSVSSTNIATGAVTTTKIADANVTAAKLASGAALSNIGTGGVTASYLASGAALSNLGTSQLADANMAPGSVIQVVYGTLFTDRVTISSSTFTPVGSGVSITPSSTSSKILITVCYSVNIAHECSIGRGANYNLSGITHGLLSYSAAVWGNESFFYYDSPASTSSQTYYLTARGYNGSTTTVYFADFSTGGPLGYMTLMEIAG
jgi:hypothetical protein